MTIHGGQSFEAIGVDLRTPEREREVITADVSTLGSTRLRE
jgi:hypothetical protein